MTYPSMTSGEAESDQILVPVAAGYQVYPLTQIFGIGKRTLRAWQGMGLAPLHFITQRGPLQDGESVLDMRWDTRTVRIVIAETIQDRTTFWDRKAEWFDLLRPNRSFNGTVKPLIYRKWLPHGKIERGTDLVTVAASNTVTSSTGRFVERGLEAGQGFHIETGADTGAYVVSSVPNDYTVILTTAPAATAAGIHWRYTRGRGVRDLYCLLAQGPNFDQGPGPMPTYQTGYREALRFIAHDPFWYGTEQTETWTVEVFEGLIFNATGAWTGGTRGIGRWMFGASIVSEAIDIVYWGTKAAKPIITITGPAINPLIYNQTLDIQINMIYSFLAGEIVTIDTQALTVTNNFGDNLMPYTGGDIATFGISPSPQAPNRINTIYIAFTGADENSEAILTWRNRYVGLQ